MAVSLWSILLLALVVVAKEDQKKISDKSEVEVAYLNVLSTIQSRFATTIMSSLVANRGSKAKEITFTAQLPDGAFISNFSMQIDNKIIYGNVKEKEKAKEEFENAKDRGESTGLVAQAPRQTNQFTVSVNVAAASKVKFNLTYQEVLTRVHGVYKHIINLYADHPVQQVKADIYITERGEIINVKVPEFGSKVGDRTNEELKAADSEPNVEIRKPAKRNSISTVEIHYQPKVKTKQAVNFGQLVTLYDVKRDQTAGEIEVVNGYFVHFFAPDGLPKGSKDIVFVLDKSGSMYGRKMEQLKDAMRVILKDLNSDDQFQILFFSDTLENWKEGFVKASDDNIKAAIKFVNSTEADGGTNIYDSLQEGIKAFKNNHDRRPLVKMLLFLTDGEPTAGNTDGDEIVKDTTAGNLKNDIGAIVHCLAFGESSDYRLLQRISAKNRGLARRIYEDSDASLQLSGFYQEISAPVLTKVKIDYLNESVDTSTLVQNDQGNYYDGGELMVLGKTSRDSINLDMSSFSAKVDGVGSKGHVAMHCISYQEMICLQTAPSDPIVIRPAWCCPPPMCCQIACPWPNNAGDVVLPPESIGGLIERMWAYKTIQKLLLERDVADDEQRQNSAKKRALELSLKYHFVTELTSMVVVKPNEKKETEIAEKPIAAPEEEESGSAAFGGGLALARPPPKPVPSPPGIRKFGQTAPTLSLRPSSGLGGGARGPNSSSSASNAGNSQATGKGDANVNGDDDETEDDGKIVSGLSTTAAKPIGTSSKAPDKTKCKIQVVFVIDTNSTGSKINQTLDDILKELINTNSNGQAAIVDTTNNGAKAKLNKDFDSFSKVYRKYSKSSKIDKNLSDVLNGLKSKTAVVILHGNSSSQFIFDYLNKTSVDVYVVSTNVKNLHSSANSKVRALIFPYASTTPVTIADSLITC